MSRIPLVDPAIASGDRKLLLEQIRSAFGVVPNMFRVVAQSNAALRSMWGAFAALGAGTLPPALGEQIAVAVANRNACDYCLAAHTAIGRNLGVGTAQMAEAQSGRSTDPKTAAALAFALAMVDRRGQASDAEVAALRAAGFDDEGIVELIAHVALNLFTNYVNVALRTPLDFPAIPLQRSA